MPEEPMSIQDDGAATKKEYDELRESLGTVVSDFCEKHELSQGALSLLLIELGITARMADYVLSVEKPSGSGLKLELDRFNREVNDLVRSSRKIADDFVASAKPALAE